MNETERTASAMWSEFAYDVLEATLNLFVLLAGTEVQHQQVQRTHSHLPLESRKSQRSFSGPSYVDSRAVVHGFDMFEITQRSGRAEQLGYKGWITEVYGCWEDRYRDKLRDALRALPMISDTIRPEVDVLGDLRHIRNDIVHNGGVASEEHMGKCSVLRWCSPGQKIILDITHVFDVLHQLHLTNSTSAHTRKMPDGTLGMALWSPPSIEALRQRQPKIASMRSRIDNRFDTEEFCVVLDLMYSNGISGSIAFQVWQTEMEASEEELRRLAKEATVTSDGNDVVVPGLVDMSVSESYRLIVEGLERPDEVERTHVMDGGAASPPIKFR